MIEYVLYVSQRPVYQGLFFFLLAVLIIILLRPRNPNGTWNIAGVLYVLFILTNSVCILTVDTVWMYFLFSLLSSVLYLLLSSWVIAALIDWMGADGSGESSMIFLSIIYHPVLLLLVLFLQWAWQRFF
ncbi:MAG: hypothetical protein V4714_02435 [Bacteroidota bacterium]